MYSAEMATYGMTYLWSFMKIGAGIQAMLRFWLSNLNSCNVGVTDGKDYEVHRWDRLRWHDTLTKFHEDVYLCWRNIRFYLGALKGRIIFITDGKDLEVRPWNAFRWHDRHTKFHED
jgi:hypothetical protein